MGDVDPRLLLAVRDNAGWCDRIARLHGVPTAADDRTWWSGRRTPDGYPDAISLSPGIDALELLRLLARIETGPGASIKDSFADLDLADHGFEVLFEATWLHRPAAAATPAARDDGTRWSRVETAQDLIPWAALHGSPAVADPRLLDQPGVAILAAHHGSRLIGGAIATVGPAAVGISNVIAADDEAAMFTRAADAVAAIAPTLPLVGYEHGATLEAALAAGFDPIGPLRVWLRP